MSVTGKDSLLDRPWTFCVRRKQILVVVGFDKERLGFANSFKSHFRRVPEVGKETDGGFSGMKNEANRINGVMRDAEGSDGDILDFKIRAGFDNAPILVKIETIPFKNLGGKAVAIDREGKVLEKNPQPTDVIAMFMRDDDPIQVEGGVSGQSEAGDDLPVAQTGIDKESRFGAFHNTAVP